MSESKIYDVELIISKSLRIGVILSAVTILAGLLMFLVSGNSGYPGNTYPTTIKEIIKGFLQLKSYGVIMTGLLILIATPVLRVAVSVMVFLKEKDYLYVKITGLVLVILLFSFMLGKVG